IHLTVAALCFLIALGSLRRFATRGLFSWVRNVTVTVGLEWTLDGARPVRKALRTHVDLPPVGDDPLRWKERHVGRTWFGKTFQDFGWLVFALFGVLLPVLVHLTVVQGAADEVNKYLSPYLWIATALGGLGLMLGMGLPLAGSVSRGRAQLTLESLLATPPSRRELLAAKWFGALARMRRIAIGLGTTVAMTCFMGGIPVVSWLFLPLTIALHTVFAANLGLYLSIVSRSTARAYVTFALIMVALTAGLWTVDYLAVMAESPQMYPPGSRLVDPDVEPVMVAQLVVH